MDIVSYNIISMYNVDKTQNVILKMPLFHTPGSHFSRKGNGTMGKIAKQKLAMTYSFRIYVGSFLANSCLKY